MNQILVTKKLYVTPELKRKKRLYKLDFIISLFLILILVSLYIYAEYDRTKSEQVSQQILDDFNSQEELAKRQTQSDVLVVVLNGAQEDENIVELNSKANEVPKKLEYTTPNGYKYYTIATISIPKINVNYPIIQGETETEEEIDELLKHAPCRLAGPDPNEVGNFCIIGHNYRNSKFFSKVPNLQNGDQINITDLNENTVTYEVYRKYIVDPTDLSCLDPSNKKEITLITCTDDSKQRVIVKAKAI